MGPEARELAVKDRFDQDRNGVLDDEERAAARAWLKENRQRAGPGGRGGPPGGFARGGPPPGGGRFPGHEDAPATPREPKRVKPEDVPTFATGGLYDPKIVRTIFLTLPQADWYEQCTDFYRTDVEVPAALQVDGKVYPDVGVGFRGNSSYFAAGRKKSFSISLDAVHQNQRLRGYRTLNLLNSHADPSFLREAIHAFVARRFTTAPRANLVQLVVNGESWGVFVNVQQFNKDFLDDEFGTRQGARWKVPAGPRGGGLAYLGPERKAYEAGLQLKTEPDDVDGAWQRWIELCRVLEQTADADLVTELPKRLDIDATLWFLAVDAALLDGDGYFSRASDFVVWEGPDHRFRPLPYDSNEIFGGEGPGGPGRGGMRPGPGGPPGQPPPQAQPPGPPDPTLPPPESRPAGDRPRPGPPGGRGGMMGGASPTSSPLALLESQGRPLARLLRVPQWRAQYLAHVRAIALEGLDWEVLGPFCQELHARIDPLVRDDDKALYGYAAFTRSLDDLRKVVALRRKTLLEHETLRGPWPQISEVTFAPRPPKEPAAKTTDVALRVRATVTGPELAAVVVHLAKGRGVAFRELPLFDDGQHDDGAAGDGVYGAVVPGGTERRIVGYVEARAAAPVSTVAFWPPAGAGRPHAIELRPR